MLTMVGMKSKIFNKYMSAKIPIKIRQALMRQIWSHQRIIDETQGGSKEIGYQIKGDLSHMYRYLCRQIVDDMHP